MKTVILSATYIAFPNDPPSLDLQSLYTPSQKKSTKMQFTHGKELTCVAIVRLNWDTAEFFKCTCTPRFGSNTATNSNIIM